MLNEIEKVTHELLLKEFSDLPQLNKDKLIAALQEAIVYLLIHDLEKLWNILYRIDVNEQKVKALFSKNTPSDIAPEMAKLIYERLQEKAITRIQYRQS
ncbi:MAG: hypothetical protein SGJ00_02595 [bacterium]|nr:hypothetical protein [bacterium]